MSDFKKTALVTGGSRGIGAATAEALGNAGYCVTINYLKSQGSAEALAGRIGGTAFKADVSDPGEAEALVKSSGGAGVLVLNAGISLVKQIQDTTPEDWRRLFSVNVDGAYNVIRAALPDMLREHWGRIIIISSMWGIRGASCEAAYSAAKAALIGLSKALAKELGPSGITVNCLCPGVIDTDMNRALGEETLRSLAEDTPLMRLGKPEDVANAVLFLASDAASFITGQVISVDGGYAV